MSDLPTGAMGTGDGARLVGGRYRLQATVGRGGSAEVWAAEDTALGRRVALKLVTAGGGEDKGRVGDEARLLARLSHPGLVPVYDAGTDEAGRPWVVMELVEGETLSDAVARGALPSHQVAETGRVLAKALAYVHEQGLVHRDVKPANVLLGRDSRVRLTDFGIARLVDAAQVTATGLTVGTASYLSPEQVTGKGVGPPADVYALGLVLLECLTGRREYPGAAVEVALARLHRQPEVPASLPAGWPGLLAAMTAREQEHRPTMPQVADELRRVAAGGQATTVVPVPVAAPDRTQVIDRTQLVDLPPQRPVARPPVRPARPAPEPRGGTGARYAVGLVLLAALGVGGAVAYDRLATGGSEGRTPAPIDPGLPPELQADLRELQDLVTPS